MSDFKIKTELLPSRCEICHQSDFFDPQTGYCSRCENLEMAPKVSSTVRKKTSYTLLEKRMTSSLFVSLFTVNFILFVTLGFTSIYFFASIFSCFLLSFFYSTSKTTLAEMFPWLKSTPKFSPTILSEFPKLDENKLHQYTFEIKALGFVRLGDYKTDRGGQITEFSRIFFHPQHQCVATIDQFFPADNSQPPIAVAITSYMEQDWSFSSTQTKDSVLINQYIFRHSKTLWINQPLLSIKELLDSHIKTRANILSQMQLTLLLDLSLNQIFELGIKKNNESLNLHYQKSFLSVMINQWIVRMFPQNEWFGSYKP